MGRIHFVRSGGIGGAGKSLWAALLTEYARTHRLSCHLVDPSPNPLLGKAYSPDLYSSSSGGSMITFDPQDLPAADRILDLAEHSEVVVDVPSGSEAAANTWLSCILELLMSGSASVADWHIWNKSAESWATHRCQTGFWSTNDLFIPQFFVMNDRFEGIPAALPPNTQEICDADGVAILVFPALSVSLPRDTTISASIANASRADRGEMSAWRERCFAAIERTVIFPESPPVNMSGVSSLKDLLLIATVGAAPRSTESQDFDW